MFEAAYRNDVFQFVAVKHMGVFTLLQARLFRNTSINVMRELTTTEMVVAGRFRIADLGIATDEFLKRALLGTVPTPAGDIRFPPGEAGRYSAVFEPFHQEGLRNQNRLSVLQFEGASVAGYVDVLAVDWHLRAAPTPFHGLEDLLFSLNLGTLKGHLSIEAVAFNVMLVDPDSVVDGITARIQVRLAHGLPVDGARVGYRILDQGETVRRGSLSGADLQWTSEQGYQVGHAEIEVPTAAVVQCFASFGEVAQHFYWITDPSTAQNARRAAFQVFDPQLEVLREFLSKQGRGQNSRDLEVGVAWLLWLLGFSVANLGGTAKTQDFADLVATTPYGHFIVVECTTGLLKTDNKLPLLVERAATLRRSIEKSNNRHLKVLAVIVTSKMREEIRADLDQAEKLGVLVITREDLEKAPERTYKLPDADQLFQEAEMVIEKRLAGRV